MIAGGTGINPSTCPQATIQRRVEALTLARVRFVALACANSLYIKKINVAAPHDEEYTVCSVQFVVGVTLRQREGKAQFVVLQG